MVILWYYNGIIIGGRAAEMPQNSEISVVEYKKSMAEMWFYRKVGGYMCVSEIAH